MVGLKLAMCGSIKDEILDLEAITAKSIEYLSINYPNSLIDRYKLEGLCDDPFDTIEMIAKKRGCLLKGGIIDTTKVCILIMNELRGNKIGAMSYETPNE